jgi:hypothetical protein
MNSNGPASAESSKGIISKLTAAGIFGILNTSFAVSYASLIFSSTAPTYFVVAVALF